MCIREDNRKKRKKSGLLPNPGGGVVKTKPLFWGLKVVKNVLAMAKNTSIFFFVKKTQPGQGGARGVW